MIRFTGPLGLLGIGALLLSLTACTSGTEVNTTQVSTTRELVLVQRPDPTSQALGHAYRDMLQDAGIQARVAAAADDPIAEVLAGHADVSVAGSGELLTALGQLPGAREDQPAATDASDDVAAPTGSPNEPSSAPSTEPTTGPTADSTVSAVPTGEASPGSSGGNPDAVTSPGTEAPSGPALDSAQTNQALRALALNDLAVLDSADAQRTGTLVITAATSAGNHLTGTEQLAPLCPKLEFGILASEAAALSAELSRTLGCLPKKVIELSEENSRGVLAVIGDAVQVQASTVDNAGIPDNALVVLEGADELFAPQVITPLLSTHEVGQDAVKALNKLSDALKQEDLLALDRMVTGRDALDPKRAATDWLTDRALLNAGS